MGVRNIKILNSSYVVYVQYWRISDVFTNDLDEHGLRERFIIIIIEY